jgi:hypothetical protein
MVPDKEFPCQCSQQILWIVLSSPFRILPFAISIQSLVENNNSYIPYILESNPHPNLIRSSFADFLNEKKKLVRSSNPHLSFNRLLRAAPSEVTRWVSTAWKTILESIIVRSFKKFCISNALNGSEDDILGEDDGEDKDDSDWVTDNDSVMSDDGESNE